MHLSPILLASLTVTTVLGIASQARGQTISSVAAVAEAETSGVLGSAQTLTTEGSAPALTVGGSMFAQPQPGELQVVPRQPAASLDPSGSAAQLTHEGHPVSLFLGQADAPEEAGDAPSPAADEPPATIEPIDETDPTAPGTEEMAPDAESEMTDPDAGLGEETPGEVDGEPTGTPGEEAPAAETEEETPGEDTPAEETDEETDEETEEETPAAEEPQEETRVLVAEVDVAALEGDLDSFLEDQVYASITTLAGRTTTRSQLQQDINNIFATGYFANVQAVPSDTPLGVRVTFVVQPNPVLTSVRVTGNQVLPQSVVDDIFDEQYGEILNLIDFQDGIIELNEWYQSNGYVLAQVTTAPQVSADGTVTLIVAEGVIEDIEVQFVNAEGDTVDENGNPIRGYTRDFIITREFSSESGDVFQRQRIEQDIQSVYGLGIFDDVRLTLNPGDEDPRKVDVVVNITERSTGSIAAGVGFSTSGDLFGTVSYQQQNFGGNNQKLGAELQVSSRDIGFDVSFTDPWIAGDPYRTSYTVNTFLRRSISLIFDGGENPIVLDNGDRVRIDRLGGSVSFSRPLGNGWTGSLGTTVQVVSSRDADGSLVAFDAAGNPLTFTSTQVGQGVATGGVDDLWTFQLGLVQDQRNDPLNPSSGYLARVATEQSVPLGRGNIFFNRLRASYNYFIPVNFTSFAEGAETIAISLQGGTVLGDLPPYEAFALGGTNSVRGYDEGDLGAGRSFVLATAEYRFPIVSFLGGALFLDAGTDLGSGSSVPGDPAGDRGKPGSGFGYGAGIRIQSPLGQIRIDYGFNDQGQSRIHFGIGERF